MLRVMPVIDFSGESRYYLASFPWGVPHHSLPTLRPL